MQLYQHIEIRQIFFKCNTLGKETNNPHKKHMFNSVHQWQQVKKTEIHSLIIDPGSSNIY